MPENRKQRISTAFAQVLWILVFFVVGVILAPVEYFVVLTFVAPSLKNNDDGIAILVLFFFSGIIILTVLGFILSLRGILPGTSSHGNNPKGGAFPVETKQTVDEKTP